MGIIFYIFYLFITFVRFPEMYPGLAPYHLMTVMGVVALLIAILGIFSNLTRALQPTTWLVLLFTLILGFSQVMAGWAGGAIFAWESFSIKLAMYLMMVGIVGTLSQLRIVVACMIISTMVLVAIGMVQYPKDAVDSQFVMIEPIYVNDEMTGEVNKRIRALGELSDPNDFAQVILIGVVALGLFWKKQAKLRNLLLVVTPMGFLIYGLYLTHSRGGLVGLAFAILLSLRARFGRLGSLAVASLVFAVLVGGSFTGGRDISAGDDSARSRLEFWSEGMNILRHHPLFGVGYLNYADENDGRAAHNSFIQCAAELGMPGYLVWLSMIVISVSGLGAVQKLPIKEPFDLELRRMANIIRIAMFVYLITGWFLSRAYTETLFTLMGMAVVITAIAKQSKPLPEVPLGRLATQVVALAVGTLILLKVMIRFHG